MPPTPRTRSVVRAAAVLAVALLPVMPAPAFAVAPHESRQELVMACRANLWQFVPPGTEVADREKYCACYAAGAVARNIPALAQAQIHPGESVLPPQATEARRLREEASDKVARACLAER